MATIEQVQITLDDLMDIINIAESCHNYFLAHDLQRASLSGQQVSSLLTIDTERVRNRLQSYLGSYLVDQKRAEQFEEDYNVYQEPEFDRIEIEALEDEAEEALSKTPLGISGFKRPTQAGRRVTAEELKERTAEEPEDIE